MFQCRISFQNPETLSSFSQMLLAPNPQISPVSSLSSRPPYEETTIHINFLSSSDPVSGSAGGHISSMGEPMILD